MYPVLCARKDHKCINHHQILPTRSRNFKVQLYAYSVYTVSADVSLHIIKTKAGAIIYLEHLHDASPEHAQGG